MKDIIKRLTALEAVASRTKIGVLFVNEVGAGLYLVERPDFLDSPGTVSTVPESLYGQIVGIDVLKGWAAVVIEQKDGTLSFMFN